jgi:ABC-type antimicrobial peptide transport system permease subunit
VRAAGDKYPQYVSARVIGIARDVISGSIIFGRDRSFVYFPTSAAAPLNTSLVMRVRGSEGVVLRTLDTTLASALPGKIEQITSMQHVLELQYLPFRIFSVVSEALGLLALMLTAAGIYGVISYLVAQRSKEIGIRMALGASPRAVVRLVLGQSSRLTTLGLAIGTLAALGIGVILSAQFSHFKGGQVRDVLLPNVFDAPVYISSIAIILAGAALAAWIPARRASRVDPIIVLRYD